MKERVNRITELEDARWALSSFVEPGAHDVKGQRGQIDLGVS